MSKNKEKKKKLTAFIVFALILIVQVASFAADDSSPLAQADLETYKQWCVYLRANLDDDYNVPQEARVRFLADHKLT
ncbi:MAG: hypothetical protein LBE31_10380 [Deltaproteobacteria bacterium]|nr:hypothetical protein [Deltaproteobacteria bacterium]